MSSTDQLRNRLFGVYIEITSVCNFNCVYCYNDSGYISSPIINQIDMDSFCKVIDSAQKLGVEEIILSGGEPILHKDCWRMLNYIRNKGISPKLITNASCLTKDFIKKIQESHPTIQITLDSYDPVVNDKYKGEGSFKLILDGIKNLRKYYDMEYVVLRCNINFDNIQDDYINEFIYFLKQQGIKYIYYSLINCEGRAKRCTFPNRIDNLIDLQKMEAAIRKLSDRLKAYNIKITAPVTGVCYACPYSDPQLYLGKYLLYVSYKGNIYPCQALSNDEFILGNIYENSIEEAYLGKKMEVFINKANQRLRKLEDCHNCILRNYCGKGCIAECIHENGFNRTDGNCKLRVEEIKRIIRKSVVNKV